MNDHEQEVLKETRNLMQGFKDAKKIDPSISIAKYMQVLVAKLSVYLEGRVQTYEVLVRIQATTDALAILSRFKKKVD